MQKSGLLLSFFLLSFSFLYGQTAPYKLRGFYIDLYGQLIDERADQDYSPYNSLNVSFNSQTEYTPGVIYPAAGNSDRGYIQYQQGKNSFNFRKHRIAKKEKIELFSGLSMTIGADSFVVANGFSSYGKLGLAESFVQELQILQFLGKTEKFTFFRYVPAGGSPNVVVQISGTREFVGLPLSQKAFYSVASDLFFDYPELTDLLKNKKIKPDEWPSLIRFIRFTDAVQANKPVLYTASWEMTENHQKSFYYAKVSHTDQNWMLDFFDKEGQKLFTEHYAYAMAAQKEGEMIWYYPGSGVIRRKTRFVKGEADNTFKTYYPNGTLHYSYTVTPNGKAIFNEVWSPDGQAVLNKKGLGKESFFDSTAKRTITREYRNFTLSSSWYTDNLNRRIYQLAKKNARLRHFKAINARLEEPDTYPERDIVAGTEGIVLLKVLLTPDNSIEEYSILQGLSKSIDREVEAIVPFLKFRAGKHDRENIYQEVILPVRFSLLRQSINRYDYQNLFWLNHHMHMQHMQQMQLQNLPTPPVIPRF